MIVRPNLEHHESRRFVDELFRNDGWIAIWIFIPSASNLKLHVRRSCSYDRISTLNWSIDWPLDADTETIVTVDRTMYLVLVLIFSRGLCDPAVASPIKSISNYL